jgi:rhodanese-related sulfurtransferase
MTVDELKKEMEENPNLVILDVRTEAELVGPLGKIDGVINIPIQLLANRMDELKPYKDKDIAVICRTGNRSTTGTEILVENGYKARNVLGGMVAYNKVKLP